MASKERQLKFTGMVRAAQAASDKMDRMNVRLNRLGMHLWYEGARCEYFINLNGLTREGGRVWLTLDLLQNFETMTDRQLVRYFNKWSES